MSGPGALGLAVIAAVCALPLGAQTPEEIVRWIYASRLQPGAAAASGFAHLSSPALRDQFLSRRMIAFQEANDSHGGDLATACIDFAPDIPGNDFDAPEILRSLSIDSGGDATRRSVTARFTSFGQPARITYEFVPEDGFWRIDDIAGPGWRISEIPCAPKPAATASGGSTGYCYKTAGDTFRLLVAGDGTAWFDLQSWQGGGHSCGAQGAARPVPDGWVYEDSPGGRPCRLAIKVTPDRGLRLADPGHGCKMSFCGQRAAIDGLSYGRANQVDCTSLPVPDRN